MIAGIIAAAALAAASGEGQVLAVNVLDAPSTLPKFVQRPSPVEFSSAYPHGAAAVGMGGKAWLHCQVGQGGRLDGCQVKAETPEGAGFGGAALRLAQSYRVDPQSTAAASGELALPIGFATSVNEDETVVTGAWLAAPTFADVAGAYPDIGGGVAGQIVLHCALSRDGALHACKTLYLKPTDRDFNVAAQKLVHLFRMQVDPAVARNQRNLAANVVMRLAAPFGDEAKSRRISASDWLATPDPALLTQVYPLAAAQKGVHAGVGVADCTVAADGSLTACHAFGAGDPPGLGFSESAAKAAASLRMSPWTEAGGPVDGALVRVPIRFSQPTVRYAGQ